MGISRRAKYPPGSCSEDFFKSTIYLYSEPAQVSVSFDNGDSVVLDTEHKKFEDIMKEVLESPARSVMGYGSWRMT